MKVIVGLGNPGKKYETTRHNVGFMAIDLFSAQHNISVQKIKHKALTGEGFISGKKILLVKPQTYMNLSGESVREIAHYYNLNPEDFLIVYDDIDLPAGRIRIRKRGSAGTHNGMRSIIYDMQSDRLARLRIGIGQAKREHLADFVLAKIRNEDKKDLVFGLDTAVSSLNHIITDGIDSAMNIFNRKPEEEDAEKPD